MPIATIMLGVILDVILGVILAVSPAHITPAGMSPPTPTLAPNGAATATPTLSTGARQMSALLARYRDARVIELDSKPIPRTASLQAERERSLIVAALAALQREGLSDAASAEERAQALGTLRELTTRVELDCAVTGLSGAGGRANVLNSAPDVCKSLFAALARNDDFGHAALIDFAVTGDDRIRQDALDALPEVASCNAEGALARFLASNRELHINRAAMIASAHASAALIPALIQAQYAPPREKKGDEGWIAIGKTTAYVQGMIPVVGDASGAFQPIVGTIFEGSLLRIMESVVEIYRTEVHASLAAVIDRTTGEPAPALGYERDQWLAWTRDELPPLLARKTQRDVEAANVAATRTTRPDSDS